ncbi:hypothetical protein QYM36_019340 [Artemia franciscana]|uniref:Uncharacterized protein n=1 Tax=Artemia franciscana TaxID=6661 RepID=A0AA88KTG3_ARTSF|nr:hypothetical protein QYM36_019340 [Artemia franciscana]
MGDNNRKQIAVDDAPTVCETLRREKDSKITQKIHSPTANVFSKGILPHRLRDKSHDLWLHQSVSFYSDSVCDNGVLPTTQNSGSNVEVHSIGTTESSDVIQEIRLQTEKLRDSTDQANLPRFVDTQETEAGVTYGTMQAAFGNSTLPNTPPKWFLEYMEAFKRDLFERSVARLDKLEEKLEKFVAILATNPVLAPNTEENTIKNTNLSKENQNFVGCGSYPNTDGVMELQKHPAQLKISQCSFPKIPADTVKFAATANQREHLDEPAVALEFIQDTLAIEIPHVEHQGTVESPISMNALQVHTDNILLKAAPECLNKATVATDDPLYGSREIPGSQYTVEKHKEESMCHHSDLMYSFAEKQQQELAKLQSQIEALTKDKKDSGIFIRVAEPIPLSEDECYVDGLKDDQKVHLSNILSIKFDKNLTNPVSQVNPPIKFSRGHVLQSMCWKVNGIRALDFMSFLKKKYKAKIISFDNFNCHAYVPINFRHPRPYPPPTGVAFWILEVDEL